MSIENNAHVINGNEIARFNIITRAKIGFIFDICKVFSGNCDYENRFCECGKPIIGIIIIFASNKVEVTSRNDKLMLDSFLGKTLCDFREIPLVDFSKIIIFAL
jgi:hypothetical protein